MFLYMQDNVLRRSGKCCATVRGMFLCGEDFDSEDGFIDFSKLTLFIIGGQGTGKSTVAKLFSLCSWLEKAFFRGDYDVVFTGGTPVVLFNTFQNIKRAFVVTSWQDERDGKLIILPDVEGKLCLIASFKE